MVTTIINDVPAKEEMDGFLFKVTDEGLNDAIRDYPPMTTIGRSPRLSQLLTDYNDARRALWYALRGAAGHLGCAQADIDDADRAV